jgi:hypothetical protein
VYVSIPTLYPWLESADNTLISSGNEIVQMASLQWSKRMIGKRCGQGKVGPFMEVEWLFLGSSNCSYEMYGLVKWMA